MTWAPGPVVLFGSGEISPGSQHIYDAVMRTIEPPVRVAVLETPAGFQLNSASVAGAVADYLRDHLPNHRPLVTVVPARKKGTPLSPDNADLLAPMLTSDMIFLGPGSPTYAVRQLKHTLAWQIIQARHRQGHAIVLASAAVIAAGDWALPVYEIYKVGEDVHWKPGLGFWAHFGLALVFVPHWDNHEGGEKHDTSRCFTGRSRFAELLALLPEDATVAGIDEHTALVMEAAEGRCGVLGRGGVTLIASGCLRRYESGDAFALSELGELRLPSIDEGIPQRAWDLIASAESAGASAEPERLWPDAVMALVQKRQAARERHDWGTADRLRAEVAALGWQIQDGPQGPSVRKSSR